MSAFGCLSLSYPLLRRNKANIHGCRAANPLLSRAPTTRFFIDYTRYNRILILNGNNRSLARAYVTNSDGDGDGDGDGGAVIEPEDEEEDDENNVDLDDENGITDEALRATIRKSKKVLAMHKDLLQQIVDRRKLISSIKDTVSNPEQDAITFNENDDSYRYADLRSTSGNLEQGYDSGIKSGNYKGSNGVDISAIPSEADMSSELSVADALGLHRETYVEQASSNSLVPSLSEPPELSDEKESQPRDVGNSSVQHETIASPAAHNDDKTDIPLARVNVINVIVVSAECAPWSKTGGLGDVAGALPKSLARRGHRVMVVAPRYGDYSEPHELGERRRYNVHGQDMEVAYFHSYIDGVDFVFIENPIFHQLGDNIYGGDRQEILRRMVLFCKAAVEVPWHVPCGGVCYGDGNLVFIANDWHTALLPVYLKAYYRDNGFMIYARCVLVIHNIAHQGRGPLDDFSRVDLPENYKDIFRLNDPFGGEHFNIFAAGLKTADRVVTVSHGYAGELRTHEGGWGLHGIINECDWKFCGIVNGIDTKEWNPRFDPHLMSDGYTNYSLETLQSGKPQCKSALQRELGLPVRSDVPVLGFIGRLDHQKGVDLIAEAMPWIAGQNVQLIMLGSGRQDLEDTLRRLESQHYDRVRGWVGFSVKMAHRITAGSDILLMPSRFEPCGLNQLYAMMYGTIPVVHAVGGLRDTVPQYNPYNETGLGWTFKKAEPNRLIDALGHCLKTYRNYKNSWEALQRRGMMQDLSWDNAAKQYEDVLVAAKFQW